MKTSFCFSIFGAHMSFLWGHWYPCFGLLVMSALVSKPGWILLACFLVCNVSQIHLWCDTCWLLRGQHGSWALLIHVLAELVSTSIGGVQTHDRACCTQHNTVNHWTTLARQASYFCTNTIDLTKFQSVHSRFGLCFQYSATDIYLQSPKF